MTKPRIKFDRGKWIVKYRGYVVSASDSLYVAFAVAKRIQSS